jgi:enterochelin esterase family protein
VINKLALLIFTLHIMAVSSLSQTAPLVSPEVSSDSRVTFRFRDPNAAKVLLQLEGTTDQIPMLKDDGGVWSLTTDRLEPDYYGYSFVADGVALIDPANPLLKPNLHGTQSMVHVPGPASLPWEMNDVPHGIVHEHLYKSGVVGDERRYFVYTPPGYNAAAKQRYPVLYLLHGYSDDADAWTAVGRANIIFDNLIAQHKAIPMIVVMPLGYGAPEILVRGSGGLNNADLRNRNMQKFSATLLDEVIPRVESEYRVVSDKKSRAIAGLSMGGGESLFVGLHNLDRFGWIGAFSTGGLGDDVEQPFSGVSAKNAADLRLVWIACGTADGLFDLNQRIRGWLTSRNIQHVDIDTPGGHTWLAWRRNLAAFAPLLFRDDANKTGK